MPLDTPPATDFRYRGSNRAVTEPEIIELERWEGPFPADRRERARRALERGDILFLPRLEFALDAPWRQVLSPAVADRRGKNVSLDPATGGLRHTGAAGQQRLQLQAMMEGFAAAATRFVHELFPLYAPRLERGRTSFRPVEIAGRRYSLRKNDRLLHVDAFPSAPTRGRRILRLFSNVNPHGEPRVWRVGEPFAEFAPRFLPSLGRPKGSWLLAALGITRGRRSAYDRLMLRLHDAAKRDAAYQRQAPQAEIAFPAGSSWLCFSDQVVHASVRGQYALEQTFYLDVEAMAEPQGSPLMILERLTGRILR